MGSLTIFSTSHLERDHFILFRSHESSNGNEIIRDEKVFEDFLSLASWWMLVSLVQKLRHETGAFLAVSDVDDKEGVYKILTGRSSATELSLE